jgi:hypothetical protein
MDDVMSGGPVRQRRAVIPAELRAAFATFKVQKKQCSTCIYRKDSPLDLEKLESEVEDGHGGFKGHRICHSSEKACCRGFWNRHKDNFPGGQIAQRFGLVEYVIDDDWQAGEETDA